MWPGGRFSGIAINGISDNPSLRAPGAVGKHCQGDNTKYILAMLCTSILCLLVLVTATLDNRSWWSASFPDAFMSTESVAEVFHR